MMRAYSPTPPTEVVTMFILSLADLDTSFPNLTPALAVQTVAYGGKFFTLHSAYQHIQDAIRNCRQALDAGLCSIVVRDPEHAKAWVAFATSDLGVGIRDQATGTSNPTATPPNPEFLFRGRKVKD